MMQRIQYESKRLQRYEQLQKMSAQEKAQTDQQKWRAWLARYHARLQLEADAGASASNRMTAMKSVNPR